MNLVSIVIVVIVFTSFIYVLVRGTSFVLTTAIVNIIIFFVLFFVGYSDLRRLIALYQDLAYKPSYLSYFSPSIYTLFTHLYLHAGALHLFGNMLILFLIGMPFEERVGRIRFALLYFLTGFAGAVTHTMFFWGSESFAVGASGAISGIMGAFLITYPRDEIPMVLGPVFLTRVPVYVGVGVFFAIQLFLAFADKSSNIAYIAHIGGLLSGIFITPLVMRLPLRQKRRFMLNYGKLAKLATTSHTKEILELIIREDSSEIKKVWLEKFANVADCPKCSRKQLSVRGIKLVCKKCRNSIDLRL